MYINMAVYPLADTCHDSLLKMSYLMRFLFPTPSATRDDMTAEHRSLSKRSRKNFLVACTRLYTPLCRSVGPSVRWSVGPSVHLSHITFFGFLRFLASLLLPKWSDLNFGPCPPARDWGSRVSGLVFK